METNNEFEDRVVSDEASDEQAVEAAGVEGECGQESQEARVDDEEAQDFSSLDSEDLRQVDELTGDGEGGDLAALESLSVGQLLAPGGGFAGSEAPVRRAIRIAVNNGLTVTSLKRSSGNRGSDHHTSQGNAFAADLSNGSSPTLQMDKTARTIAAALGHPSFRAGVLNVTHKRARAQLLWRTNVGGNHFNHVHFGVRMSGASGGAPIGHPRLTEPHMRGEGIRNIQRRLLDLGFGPLSGGADGVFGPQTDAAVRRLQEARGLTVDGVVGPQTKAALG